MPLGPLRRQGGIQEGLLSLQKPYGVKLIFKHAEKNYQLIIAQVGQTKCGVDYISPAATRSETEKMPPHDKHTWSRQGDHVWRLECTA